MTTYIPPADQIKTALKSLPPKKQTSAQKQIQRENKKANVRKLHARVQRVLLPLIPHETEVMFHPTRKWRIDYAWPEHKIAVEIHGGVHNGGRHTRGTGFVEDRIKMNEAQLLGWIVIEASPDHMKQLFDWIVKAFEIRGVTCIL